jgi:large subunit ribosomal protein L18
VVGNKPIFAVRVSNKYVYGQVFIPSPTGDQTLCAVSTKELSQKHQWKGSNKNIPASYLLGYLLGKKALAKNIKEANVYSGIGRFVHGSRFASAIGGARDAGLNLGVAEEALPSRERTSGAHISAYAHKLSEEDHKTFEKKFSKAKSTGFDPADYSKHFETIKDQLGKMGAP